MQVKVDSSEAVRQMEADRRSLLDTRRALEAVVEEFARKVERNFAQESAADQPWPPLAEATIADRERKGFGAGPILRRTGDMASGATGTVEYDGDGVDVSPEPETPAAYHMSTAPRTKIPLRDFYALSEEDEEDLERALARALDDAAR